MQAQKLEKEEDIFCLRNNVLDLKEFGNMNKRNWIKNIQVYWPKSANLHFF